MVWHDRISNKKNHFSFFTFNSQQNQYNKYRSISNQYCVCIKHTKQWIKYPALSGEQKEKNQNVNHEIFKSRMNCLLLWIMNICWTPLKTNENEEEEVEEISVHLIVEKSWLVKLLISLPYRFCVRILFVVGFLLLCISSLVGHSLSSSPIHLISVSMDSDLCGWYFLISYLSFSLSLSIEINSFLTRCAITRSSNRSFSNHLIHKITVIVCHCILLLFDLLLLPTFLLHDLFNIFFCVLSIQLKWLKMAPNGMRTVPFSFTIYYSTFFCLRLFHLLLARSLIIIIILYCIFK